MRSGLTKTVLKAALYHLNAKPYDAAKREEKRVIRAGTRNKYTYRLGTRMRRIEAFCKLITRANQQREGKHILARYIV